MLKLKSSLVKNAVFAVLATSATLASLSPAAHASNRQELIPETLETLDTLDPGYENARVYVNRQVSFQVENLRNSSSLVNRGVQFAVTGNVSEFVLPSTSSGKILSRRTARGELIVSFEPTCLDTSCAFTFSYDGDGYYLSGLPSDRTQGSDLRVFSRGGLHMLMRELQNQGEVPEASGRIYTGTGGIMDRRVKLEIVSVALRNVSHTREVIGGFDSAPPVIAAPAAEPAPEAPISVPAPTPVDNI